MKNLNLINFLLVTILSFLILSCNTTEKLPKTSGVLTDSTVKNIPVIQNSEKVFKVQAEDFFITDSKNAKVVKDVNAEQGICVQLKDKSVSLKANVVLEQGFYEILICEKATINGKCNLKLIADGFSYKVKTSDPPLCTWELTTRTPCYFTADTKQTVTIEIVPDFENKYLTSGPKIDYILFTKR